MRGYKDEDYLVCQSLYAAAFHEMRVRVGCFPDSAIAQPSEKERQTWKENAANRFVYKFNGEIVAYGHIPGNEIGSVSVRTDVQGRGIGRTFVKYLCNEIIRRGNPSVSSGASSGIMPEICMTALVLRKSMLRNSCAQTL
ncbi:GNAT family N-acetyltransferase [Paenibacillus sp. JTLBN-2024]